LTDKSALIASRFALVRKGKVKQIRVKRLARFSNMRTKFIAVVLVIASLLFVAFTWFSPTGHIQNAGFLLLGSIIAVGKTHAIEWEKKRARVIELSRILHIELSNLVARSCYDYENSWSNIQSKSYNVVHLQKFSPSGAVVYPAVASEIALIGAESALAIVQFHYRLDALRREMANIVKDANEKTTMAPIEKSALKLVALRFEQTLPAGLEALEKLSSGNADAEKIEAAAIRHYDAAGNAANSEFTLRERLKQSIKENV